MMWSTPTIFMCISRFVIRKSRSITDICHNSLSLITTDPGTVVSYSPTTTKSWIGQTVTLKCVSDGVPTPTVTWYKPDGSELIPRRAKENTFNVNMAGDGDFGDYKCVADNGFKPADIATVTVQQISKFCLFRSKY